jgi:hypothetical protein
VPPFPPFGLPANQESVHSYLESSTFWNPAQQGGSGDSAEDVKATPLRIWGGSVVDVLITSLVVIRLSWAAGYLEIRNFTTGNSGCVRSAAQRRRRERGAAQRGSTGRRTATKATCFRRLLLCFFFLERVAEDRCFRCRGRCPLCVLATLAGGSGGNHASPREHRRARTAKAATTPPESAAAEKCRDTQTLVGGALEPPKAAARRPAGQLYRPEHQRHSNDSARHLHSFLFAPPRN